jgi:hypothetical protein
MNTDARERALESIIDKVCDLIGADRVQDIVPEFYAGSFLPGERIVRRGRHKSTQDRDQLSKSKQDGHDHEDRKATTEAPTQTFPRL